MYSKAGILTTTKLFLKIWEEQRKISGSVKQITCLYYQIQRNFTIFICSSWPLNRKLLTERPAEGNVIYFGEQFVLLPGSVFEHITAVRQIMVAE